MSTGFSAGSSALGYLFQARYALYLILKDREELELSIEGLDDIAFDHAGTPYELLQLKHHTTPASLTDSSSDLWKTIRIWSTYLRENKISLPGTKLTLVTTGLASQNSIPFLLRSEAGRDSGRALEKSRHVAQTSINTDLRPAFEAFNGLTSSQQVDLINSIQIIDSSPSITDVTLGIKNLLLGVRRVHRDSVYERLEGWWFSKVIRHISDDSINLISGIEVRDKICEINDQFGEEALPIDFFNLELPEQPDISTDERRFVAQLKAIAVHNRRIEKAILDYYRAFEQRSRWAREDLLVGDELEVYEKKLVDEWERYMLARQDELVEVGDETSYQRLGRDVFTWMDQTADVRIREKVTEEYVMRGSYHMLADGTPPSVYWHPKFVERLAELLPAQ